jgi:hypothetical protein
MLITPSKAAFLNEAHAARYLSKGRERPRAKKEAVEKGERRAKLKTRGDWLREAQMAFNAFIRERDRDLPCVSCGGGNDIKQNAGHYRSVGSCPSLRFEESQVWKQCERCNSHLSGNLILYRQELLRRVGPEKLEWIEGPHAPKKYTIEQIKQIKAIYKERLKKLREMAIIGPTRFSDRKGRNGTAPVGPSTVPQPDRG